MSMKDKILINDIDVTKYRLKWESDYVWKVAIDSLEITFSSTLKESINLRSGLEVKLYRNYDTPDKKILYGTIARIEPMYDKTKVIVKGIVEDAIKNRRTKSWDINIDTTLGIGSEIFKDLCDHSGLKYTPIKGDLSDGSIQFTGSAINKKIAKFIQNDEDNFDRMNLLAEQYDFLITYDYENDLLNFKDKGFEKYPIPLRVGIEIPGQIKWKENKEQMINKIKIQGATVYDRIVETFAGPTNTITLSKNPDDTELRANFSTTNNLLVRGQKDVGTLGVNYNYYIDEDQKKIYLDGNYSDLWINYGSQVPLPVILSDIYSIEKYGGPNKIPHYKKKTFNDIKDLEDAQNRGRAILKQFSLPFFYAQDIPIKDSVIQEYGEIKPGTLVNIIDKFNDKDLWVLVSSIKKSWPHVYDKISVGDGEWRLEDWQANQLKDINKIFSELNKNQDILYHVFENTRDIRLEKRYFEIQNKKINGDFIIGHSIYGIIGNMTLGSVSPAWQTVQLVQGEDVYKELLYDDLFFDSVRSDPEVVWDTTNRKIIIPPQKTLYTKTLEKNSKRNTFKINLGAVTNNEDIVVSVTYDNRIWIEVTNFDTVINFPVPATDIRLKIFNGGTA